MGTAYSIDKLQDRGSFFVDPGETVYGGQIIGEHIRPGDLVINICEAKKLTNMRASGHDENARITPKIKFSLEEAMERLIFIFIFKNYIYFKFNFSCMKISKMYFRIQDLWIEPNGGRMS